MQIIKIVSVTKTLHLRTIFSFLFCSSSHFSPLRAIRGRWCSYSSRNVPAFVHSHLNSFLLYLCCYFSNFPLGPRFRGCDEFVETACAYSTFARLRCHHSKASFYQMYISFFFIFHSLLGPCSFPLLCFYRIKTLVELLSFNHLSLWKIIISCSYSYVLMLPTLMIMQPKPPLWLLINIIGIN